MDAGEGVLGTTIEDLPNELLFEIFRRAKYNRWQYQGELLSMQHVCCRWHAVIDEWIGTTVNNSTRRIVHPSNPEMVKEGLELISEIGVSSFSFYEENDCLNSHVPSVPLPSEPLPFFKLPYLLKELRISGPINPDVFSNLTKNLNNLALFRVTWQTLLHLRRGDVEQLNLPRLTDLEVIDWAASDVFHLSPSLLNFQSLLKENRFPLLTKLTLLQIPVPEIQDLKTMKVLIPFILAHRALKDLSVTMYNREEMTPVNASIYKEDLGSIIAGIRGGECSPSLKELSLEVNGLELFNGAYPQLEVWLEFLKMPTSVKVAMLEIGPIPHAVLKTFCSRNGATLKKLSINQYVGSARDLDIGVVGAQLDCSALSSLQCLKHLLVIRGNREVVGVRHLSSSLEEIQLSGFMRSEEVEILLLHHQNMQNIHLSDLYNGAEGYGVTLDILRRFVQNRKVGLLLLERDSISEESPGRNPQW